MAAHLARLRIDVNPNGGPLHLTPVLHMRPLVLLWHKQPDTQAAVRAAPHVVQTGSLRYNRQACLRRNVAIED